MFLQAKLRRSLAKTLENTNVWKGQTHVYKVTGAGPEGMSKELAYSGSPNEAVNRIPKMLGKTR